MFRAFVLALSLLCATVGWAQPANDLCTNAIVVFNGVNPNPPLGMSGSFFTNVGAGTEATLTCSAAAAASTNDVWFTYTATASGLITISPCPPPGFAPGTLVGALVSVHVACGAAELL